NGLMKLGARVISKADAKVHVSGHASGGELLYSYNIVKPRGVMPVHGEWRHLLANARHAEATGVDRENIVLADDGWVVDLKDGRAEVVGAVDCNYVFVDGSSVGEITEADLKDRLVLSGERSEEHTSELQSRFDLVCRLLLEKKKKNVNTDIHS